MAEPVVTPSWRMFTPDLYPGQVGGTGTVFGTTDRQDIGIIDLPGTVTLDPSFNRGGDVVRLHGSGGQWEAKVSGSTAVLSDGDTTVVIPVGTVGLELAFEDGLRLLRYDSAAGIVKIEGQPVGAEFATIQSGARQASVPDFADHEAFARIFVGSGGDATIGGHYDVFGTLGAETVTVLEGHAHFDASFNRGGDTVVVAGDAGEFGAEQTGSFATFVSDTVDVSIPVGKAGAAVVFDDGTRTLRYDDMIGHIMIGAQTIVAERTALGAAPDGATDMVLFWNDVALDAIAAAKVAPPAAARALAIQAIAVWDAIAALGDMTALSVGLDPDLGAADINAAVAYASHAALGALIPSQAALFDAALEQVMPQLGSGPAFELGRETGSFIGGYVVELRAEDGWDATVTYVPGSDPGDWTPTLPSFAAPALPHWGDVTPLLINDIEQFRAPPPPALDSAAYAAAVNQVQALGAIDSSTRTDDQTEIAIFWRDNAGTYTPPGHWNAIAQAVAAAEGTTTAENAMVFALLNIAVADAGIAAWDTKYTYNEWRPISAIRGADLDGNPATIADADWLPLIATPNHPTYVSGHSTFSGAAAGILTAIFGEDYAFTATAQELPGVTRDFDSFQAAADEAGISRIYGGIHFAFDNEVGLAMGASIAELVTAVFGATTGSTIALYG